jgi:transketolase
LRPIFTTPRGLQSQPLCVIAQTHKGQGVSFMRDQVFWHHGVLSQAQYELAMREIGQ